ncbi:MAG TPA: hypothetical protein VLL52_07460 [Anaerolineae bacterium]|nr:hypothetical protein [Anaerolineae bacterium]
MTTSIKQLKQNYKINLALGHNLPVSDRAIPLPLSTGTPLYDAALTNKIVPTHKLNEAQHLNRAWHLVQQATPHQQQTLATHGRGLLNDYKRLLALHTWQQGNHDLTRQFIDQLPWTWRLSFPTAIINPARQLFTGWRRQIKFRLIDHTHHAQLFTLFRQLLASTPPQLLLKYRNTIKESAALLHYRFEGDRERAIHDLCFHNGRHLPTHFPDLEPIPTYLKARQALGQNNLTQFLTILEEAPQPIPLTTFMGLLGNARLRLTDNNQPHIDQLRQYTITAASPVESLLHLNQWHSWLTPAYVDQLATKIRHSIIDQGHNIPFSKLIKAFLNTPLDTRRLTLEPLYLPLLHHFSQQMSHLLPTNTTITYIQPGNVIHITSLLLYSILNTTLPTRFIILNNHGTAEIPPIDLHDLTQHLTSERQEYEKWLLDKFGRAAAQHNYEYDYPALSQTLNQINPQHPLLLDLPFAYSTELIAALHPFEQVFNLNHTFGAPGEICLAYEYYLHFMLKAPRWHIGLWHRNSDQAAYRFVEFLEKLDYFQKLSQSTDTI